MVRLGSAPGYALDLAPSDLSRALIWRFHALYVPVDLKSCWSWEGTLTPKNYGVIKEGSSRGEQRRFLAHRLSWVLYSRRGLAGDLTIDHTCLRHSCVNPLHLEPVSRRVNAERAYA
jgi:hypothetical protein